MTATGAPSYLAGWRYDGNMLTRAEAESIKANLAHVMAGTMELADLVDAIDRETEPEPMDVKVTIATSRARTRDFESVTQPIPLETMREIVDRGRRPTKDLDP